MCSERSGFLDDPDCPADFIGIALPDDIRNDGSVVHPRFPWDILKSFIS